MSLVPLESVYIDVEPLWHYLKLWYFWKHQKSFKVAYNSKQLDTSTWHFIFEDHYTVAFFFFFFALQSFLCSGLTRDDEWEDRNNKWPHISDLNDTYQSFLWQSPLQYWVTLQREQTIILLRGSSFAHMAKITRSYRSRSTGLSNVDRDNDKEDSRQSKVQVQWK